MEQNIISKEPLEITDAQSLKSAIEKMETRVAYKEIELKNMLSQLPKEGMKSATAAVLPAFLSTRVVGASVSGAWNLVKLAAGRKKTIFPLIGSAARVGLFSFLKKKIISVKK